MKEATPWRGRLMGLLLILAVSNLAPGPSTTYEGYRSSRSGNCCVAARESVFRVLEVSNAILEADPGATVGRSLIAATVDTFDIFEISLRLLGAFSGTIEAEGIVNEALHRDDRMPRDSRIRSPGFQNVEIVADAVLTRVSDSEYSLEATTSEQFVGFNVKEYLGVEATPYDEEGRELERDPSIIYRAYLQVRGFGHHILTNSDSHPVVKSNQRASISVSVYDPGKDAEVSSQDWDFSVTPRAGYERFLNGSLEVLQDLPNAASAEIEFRADTLALPAGQKTQRVPLLVTATAEGLPTVSKRVNLFLVGE